MAPLDVAASSPPVAVSDDDESLDSLLGPGDVLFIRGENRAILQIGTTGGSFGHVVLVTGRPRCIAAGSDEAYKLQAVFPKAASRIWSVPTVESTSSEEGLHQAELLLVVDSARRVIVIGEQPSPTELIAVDHEVVELWQSPEELRAQMCEDIFESVIQDMKVHEANWSFLTAARAWLTSAAITESTHADKASLLREVQDCWLAAPICTSIVIIFWQRYLCTLAGRALGEQCPMDLVLRWMPVKADRGLPDELLEIMRAIGWRRLATVPRLPQLSPALSVPALLTSMSSTMSAICSLRQEQKEPREHKDLQVPKEKKTLMSL